MANPTLLTQPFAANGDKNIIPNTTTTQGAFSQDKGFPAECSLPLGAGGVAPSRQDFNGAFNMLSALACYAQKGYTWHWEAAQEYYKDCVVVDESDGNIYRCVNDVAAGGSAPSADPTNWQLAFDGRYLPLNGGQMTDICTISNDTDNGRIIISGGSNALSGGQKGARIVLAGKDNTDTGNAGGFLLETSNRCGLYGKPDGSLTWNNKEIKSMAFPSATIINITSALNWETLVAGESLRARYTAPTNGYLRCEMRIDGAKTWGAVLIASPSCISSDTTQMKDVTVCATIPMRRGQTADIVITNIVNRNVIFAYAEGEV